MELTQPMKAPSSERSGGLGTRLSLTPARPATLSATSLPVPFELGPSVQVPGSQRQLLSHCRVSGLPHPSPQERMWSLEPNPSRRELTPGLGRGFLFLVLTAESQDMEGSPRAGGATWLAQQRKGWWGVGGSRSRWGEVRRAGAEAVLTLSCQRTLLGQ